MNMAKQDLVEYIKSQLQKGCAKEDIRNSLLNIGWKSQDIDDAFYIQDRFFQGTDPHPTPSIKSLAYLLAHGINLKRIVRLTPPEYRDRMWLGFLIAAITIVVLFIGFLTFLNSL